MDPNGRIPIVSPVMVDPVGFGLATSLARPGGNVTGFTLMTTELKNHLFAGSDGGAESWAVLASLIQTAKLNDVEPFAYLRDVLERIVSGKTKANELNSLLPWAWKASQAQAAVKS